MKCIIFDSSTLISLTMNGLLEEFRELKKMFNGKFIIPKEVKGEVVDKPLKIKVFELEGLMINELLTEGVLEMPSSLGIKDEDISRKTQEILKMANSTFEGKNENIHLLDLGETACLALSKIMDEKGIRNVISVDERTTRMLAENPENLRKLMQGKLHTDIKMNRENFKFFESFKFIRSAELVYLIYKKKLFKYMKDGVLLDALLYAVKYHGCSISDEEIAEMKKL
jgi:hypothetical protein